METRTLGLNTQPCIDKLIHDFNFKIENEVGVHIEYILSCIELKPDDTFASLKAEKLPDNSIVRGTDWVAIEFDFEKESIPIFLFDPIREFFKEPFKTSDNKYIVEVFPNFSENKIWVKFQRV